MDTGLYLVYSGSNNFVISFLDVAERLIIGNETRSNQYVREVESPDAGILGVWSNDVGEMYFSLTTYSWTSFVNPLQPEIGTYNTTGEHYQGTILTKSLRSTVTINDNHIVFTPPWGEVDIGTYSFSDNNNTLTIDLASGSNTFRRIMEG